MPCALSYPIASRKVITSLNYIMETKIIHVRCFDRLNRYHGEGQSHEGLMIKYFDCHKFEGDQVFAQCFNA